MCHISHFFQPLFRLTMVFFLTPRCLHRRLCGFFLEVESLGMASCLNNRLSPFTTLSEIKRAVSDYHFCSQKNVCCSKMSVTSHLKKNCTWMFPKIVGFPPKSSILRGFSIIFTLHFGVPLFLETTSQGPCCCLDSSVFSSWHSALWVDKSCPPGGVESYILQKGNNSRWLDTYDIIVQYIYHYLNIW